MLAVVSFRLLLSMGDRKPAGGVPPGRTGFPSMRRPDPAQDGVALAGRHAEGDILRRNQNFGPHQAARCASA